MKKILVGFAGLLTLLGSGILADTQDKDTGKLVSLDSILLMQKSKEGKKLGEKIQKEVEDFQKFAKNAQKEITEFQETVSKQAKALSKDALAEKGEKLVAMKKNAERSLEDKEESLKRSIQRQQIELRNRQMKVANTVFEQKKWGLMIDSNTPGVLFVSKAIDKTDEILKVVDENYGKDFAKNIVEKEQGKSLSKSKSVKGA